MWLAFRSRKPFQLDFETQMSPKVFAFSPECCFGFLRKHRSPSPESALWLRPLECMRR